LLQQRAADKITFLEVWTNCCCSHPLLGMCPEEVDAIDDVRRGSVDAIKRAAVRKLRQELDIRPQDASVKGFKYLTRMHYWAVDVVTHGPTSTWGEHEIDYILCMQVPNGLRFEANLEEVMDTRWVDLAEVQAMMAPDAALQWSPWFRIVAETPGLLPPWWGDAAHYGSMCRPRHYPPLRPFR